VPSAPVMPHGDPTLLFTNAGMNQFKDVFLEQGSRLYTRAVNSQKCIRVSGKHNDLDEVGYSPSHHTFFEMLGNWSFGDYYKREAIQWAWQLLTEVWGFDRSRLYATIFKGDDQVDFDEEAYKVWREVVGLPDSHISAHGKKDNFWEMGEVGPCGPCSELHYDFGASFCAKSIEPGHICSINGVCGRFIELWNLVFIQYRCDESGALHPLPRKHVDTGAGFERLVKALEGVRSNYDTSLFKPLIEAVVDISKMHYSPGKEGIAHRVVADHIRMLAFALADGVLPSNEGRGYVLRRVLRRAARYGREIGLEAPFLSKLVEPLISVMGEAYVELKARRDHIAGVIKAEEESFGRTLSRGLEIFGGIVNNLTQEKSTVIKGDDAFKLYDTYGFPLDLTELMARERGLTVDTARFDKLMTEQKQRARGESRFAAESDEFGFGYQTEFVGYNDWLKPVTAKVLAVQTCGNKMEIVLDRTPFYVEAGGQVDDRGWLEIDNQSLQVTALFRRGGAVVHQIEANEINLQPGMEVAANIDQDRRRQIQYNHTATHLLHKALRKLIGPHCSQAGSLVAPDRLRFDFTHFEKLTDEQIKNIEQEVNAAIRADYPVKWDEMPYKHSIDIGIVALFGEKYGEIVRVVQVGADDNSYSRELCGGCHTSSTGRIGLFLIVSEEAASMGVRRIEAVTGETALGWTQKEHYRLEQIQDLIGSRGSDVVDKLTKTLTEKKALEKEVEKLLGLWAMQTAGELLASAVVVNNLKVAARLFPAMDIERLKMVGDAIRSKDSRAVALLAAPNEASAGQLCCVVGNALIAEGKLKAGDLVGKAAKLAGGGGGGRPHIATAGTKTPELLPEAVKGFAEIVKSCLKA